MHSDPDTIDRAIMTAWMLDCGSRYWPCGAQPVLDLPLATSDAPAVGQYSRVALPEWAYNLGVGQPSGLLVDQSCLFDGPGPPWQRCDWLRAAWLHLTGAHERRSEAARGPAHSYSFAIAAPQPELYDRAWVNRIFLFLRRWAARSVDADEDVLFGTQPSAELVMTHDVDAIRLTPEIRAKQAAFQLFNAVREAARGRGSGSARRLANVASLALSRPDWWTFAEIRRLEENAGVRSILHFYGGQAGWRRRHPAKLLFDPGYAITDPRLATELACLHDGGWTIGVHGSIASWNDAQVLTTETARVAGAAGIAPRHTRQHWLRFSWAETWATQVKAGLAIDSTLGFNDRPGFRNGAALAFRPWNRRGGKPHDLIAMPMVLMDSHFYDYQVLDDDARLADMAKWIDEVRAVGGVATVNWHTHTIREPYGWGQGYKDLLAYIA